MPKLSVSISRVSVEGLKLVILSADFLLNFVGFGVSSILHSASEVSIISSSTLVDSLVQLLLIMPVLREGMLRNENLYRNYFHWNAVRIFHFIRTPAPLGEELVLL